MKTFPADKLRLAVLIAKNDSKRIKNKLFWVITGYSKSVVTQKAVGDPVVMVGSNDELPASFNDIVDCYYKGKQMKW